MGAIPLYMALGGPALPAVHVTSPIDGLMCPGLRYHRYGGDTSVYGSRGPRTPCSPCYFSYRWSDVSRPGVSQIRGRYLCIWLSGAPHSLLSVLLLL
ncbi:hypothetical protein GDO81_017665 [Engystomops pustulosus]|uniref:Uncharacterized protein n=1 Tax=Engystomops pustulosus TaxID=76066 RepID=A0AAV7A159_ENGPU|nr:hypothetical protein GDO81_017665 [Engystomops pustulosus]